LKLNLHFAFTDKLKWNVLGTLHTQHKSQAPNGESLTDVRESRQEIERSDWWHEVRKRN
jgi:hypothetical protein